MTVTGGAWRGRRIIALSLFGALIAAALALGHGAAIAQAAESAGKPAAGTAADTKTPAAKAAGAKKAAGTGTASATKKKKSTTVAKTKHPLPPPRKPTALAAAIPVAKPSAAKTATIDVATSLENGAADVLPTAAQPVEPNVVVAPPEPATTLTKESLRIQFSPGGADLPESAEPAIGKLAALMSRDPSLRLQLLAFATGTKETASQSRRLSLNRALAVRGALIDAGVRSTRIDVRALGNQTEDGPTDRVDVLVMQRGGG